MNAFSRTPGRRPRRFATRLAVVPLVGLMLLPAASADAGNLHAWLGRHLGSWGWCHGGCRDFGGTGCGPRYLGAVHEDPHCVDPCDGCNRWRGCHGARELPDMLAPWQLPPGRGFLSAGEVGWKAGPCRTCGPGSSAAPCGSCEPCGARRDHASRPWRSVFYDIRPRVWEWWPH